MNVKIPIYIFSPMISTISIACPLCTTSTGEEVRALLFNHHFFINLLFLFSPFIVFILIASLIYYWPPNEL